MRQKSKVCLNNRRLKETTEYERIGTKHCVNCGWSVRGDFYETIFGDLCWVCYEDFVHAENGLSEPYLADQYFSVADGDVSILDKHKSNLKQIIDKLTKAWRKYRKDFMQRVAYYPAEIKEIEEDFKKTVTEYLTKAEQVNESVKKLNLRSSKMNKMKLHEEFKLYETMWESTPTKLAETRKKNPTPPPAIRIVKIEPKLQEPYDDPARRFRHYDEITYIDPIFNIEMKASVWEEQPGFGNYFGWGAKHSGQWDYAAYSYEGKLLSGINPTGHLDPKLKAAFSDIVGQVNNPSEYSEEE